MSRTADETRQLVLGAMEEYERIVLQEKHLDENGGFYKYPYRISKAEVLRLAGIKSRGTLNADYHTDLERSLNNFIDDLKNKAGKRRRQQTADSVADIAKSTRLNKMAQTIVALQYRIMALDQEVRELRHGNVPGSKVTSLASKRRRQT